MKDGRLVVLLTGANGFVGRNVAPMLMANGIIVRQAMRKLSPDANAVIIDAVGPHTNWEEALVGVDAVVHLAARVHHPREEHAADIYRSINTEGTLHLARCAAKAGVSQFIYLSSVLVNGSSTDGRPPFREDLLIPRGVYGLSKAAAEAGLDAMAKDSEMNITVIRPPLIYGVGALGNFKLLAMAVDRGIPLPFGSKNWFTNSSPKEVERFMSSTILPAENRDWITWIEANFPCIVVTCAIPKWSKR